MKIPIKDILESLSQKDVEALRSIYLYRCLTESQISELHYNSAVKNTDRLFENEEDLIEDKEIKERIKLFISLNLIEEVERITKVVFGKPSPVYFLTTIGIEVVRHCFDMPTNIYDMKKQVVRRGYYRASELRLHPKLINHQVHLNQFVLDFVRMNKDVKYKYYDEKYVSQFTNIRPDGMLSLLDTDFFIEMDMATESKKQLFDKWENYRNFLNSREYAYKERKIVVLFVCENTTRLEERINLIKHTIFERMVDIIDSDFEIYAGAKEDLLYLMKDKLIPNLKNEQSSTSQIKNTLTNQHEFEVFNGDMLKNHLNETEFNFYIRKLDNEGNTLIENGKVQEFVIDDFIFSPLGVFSKITYLDKSNLYFRQKYNRDISYIVVGESEEILHTNMKLVDLTCIKNVYFTTPKRLQELSFANALFQFDFLGNVYHFTNNGLEERIFEKALVLKKL